MSKRRTKDGKWNGVLWVNSRVTMSILLSALAVTTALFVTSCQKDTTIKLAGCKDSDTTTVRGTLNIMPSLEEDKNSGMLLLVDKQNVETVVRPDETGLAKLVPLVGHDVEVVGHLSEVEWPSPAVKDDSGELVSSLRLIFRLLANEDPDTLVQLTLLKVRFLGPCK